MSAQELAGLCNFEKSNMSRLESGNTNPTIWTLYKICQALGVSLEEIVAQWFLESLPHLVPSCRGIAFCNPFSTTKPGTPSGMKVIELVHYKLTRIERVQDVPLELWKYHKTWTEPKKIAKMAISTVYEQIPEVTTLRASGKYFLMPILIYVTTKLSTCVSETIIADPGRHRLLDETAGLLKYLPVWERSARTKYWIPACLPPAFQHIGRIVFWASVRNHATWPPEANRTTAQ